MPKSSIKPARPAKKASAAKPAPKRAPLPKPARTKRPPGRGLSKPVALSPELAAVIGPEPRARSAVVADLWSHIRDHKLQDPADKRTIRCDEKLRAVLGRDRVGMLEMHALLAPHMTAVAA